MGIGMPLVSATSNVAVTAIDDLLWENYSDSDGEIAINYQQKRINLVRHSNFATDAIWSKTNSTINTSSGVAPVSVTNGAFSFLSMPVSYTSGQTYTLSAEINGTVDKQMRFQDIANDSGGLTTSNGLITMTGQPQRVSITFVANANSNSIVIARHTASGDYSFTVKNVQVEEGPEATAFIITEGDDGLEIVTTLNDTSDVWDFDGADLTPEVDPDSEGVWERPSNIVVNHDFAVDANWTKGTGWSISDGKAVAVAPNSSGFNLSQSNILTSGETYEITFTVSERTAGSVRFRANSVNGTTRSTNGTFTEIITVAGTTFILQALNSFVGKIDNVTVEEYAITPLDV